MPVAGVADTSVSPAGRTSVTWTPVASDGPALPALIVNVTFEPVVTLPLLATFVTTTSACELMAVESEAVSFEVLSSLPPATVAVLVSGLVADWLIKTVIVITG